MYGSSNRFISMWSGVATIVFFADIFLGYKPFGYSGVMLGIFMWIVGGSVSGLIFGPKKRHSRRHGRRRDRTSSKSTPVVQETGQFCIACGSEYPRNATYCPECGTATVTLNQEVPAK